MPRAVFICILFGLLNSLAGKSQPISAPALPAYSYYHPSKDKESWRRLNLLLSSTFIVVAREGQVEHDTCLYLASHSLGLSRFPVLAEGFYSNELLEQSQWVDRRNPAAGINSLSKSKGRERLQLLVLLGSYYTFQPHSYYRYKDSVEYFLNKAIEESRSLKEEKLGRIALCLLGKIYVQANDSKGDSIYNLLIDQCRKSGDKETEARAFAYRGMYAAPTPETFERKITDLQKAADLYHNLGNRESEINVLTDLGYMLVVTTQLPIARETFLKALTLAEGIHYPYTHYISDAISMVTSFQGKFGEPLRYTHQAIKIAESCRDSIGWGHFYSRLSHLYDSEGRINESTEMAQKAIKRFITDHNPAVYTILVTVLIQMCDEGRATEALAFIQEISTRVNTPEIFADQFAYHNAVTVCYLYLKKLDLAEIHIRKMDSLENGAEAVRGPLRRTVISDMFGHVFFQRGQYRKAQEFFEKHFTTPSYGQRTLLQDMHIYRWLIITDSVLGDNAAAVSHYKKYTQLLDSNYRVTKIRQAEELQVIYEMQEKQTQIALLDEKATRATVFRNLTLGGIVAVIIIATLLYRQSRLRRKNNTIITFKNEQLQQLLGDKEWLLKEIHHRVKNNLQIVMSLLNSQAVYIHNDAALSAIKDSKRRVHAMALLHQKLYLSENMASIGMPAYIHELSSHVQESFDMGNRIIVEQHIEALDLDVSQAIPLGLIINECLVNSIKYAFPDEREGTVLISLRRDGPDHILLNISDNGTGLPEGLNIKAHNSLGLDLIQGLTKQLKGSSHIENKNGLHIQIRFPIIHKPFSDEASADVKQPIL